MRNDEIVFGVYLLFIFAIVAVIFIGGNTPPAPDPHLLQTLRIQRMELSYQIHQAQMIEQLLRQKCLTQGVPNC